MRILAIDTASSLGSLALLDGDSLEECPLSTGVNGFDAVLFQTIQELVGRSGFSLRDIDCFAVSSGPGSFSGVRIGIAAAASLAEGSGRSAMGISTLEALASGGTMPLRAAVLDARRGEVFCGVFTADGTVVEPERALPVAEWVRSLPPQAEIVLQDGAFLSKVDLGGRQVRETRALAGAVARMAQNRLGGAANADPILLDANYVRRSDARMAWRDERCR